LLIPLLSSGEVNRSLVLSLQITNKNIAVRNTCVMWIVSASLMWLIEIVNFQRATEIMIIFRHSTAVNTATSNSLSCVDKLQKETHSPAEHAPWNFPWLWTLLFVCFWRDSPQWARTASFGRFLDHTQRRTTVGMTPLGE
jgi:hypothetical protein